MKIVPRGIAITIAALSIAGSALGAPVKTVLYNFTGTDGAGPSGGLIFGKDGALYGTTAGGGSGSSGAVFKLTPPPYGPAFWIETVLYSFRGSPSDGVIPLAGLIADKDGALYGTTFHNGSDIFCSRLGSCGTVFKLTPPSKGQTVWTETVLYFFTGDPTDGASPTAGLIFGNDGALYGTTVTGTTGNPRSICAASSPRSCGTVFKLTPPANRQTAWKETVIYGFMGNNGSGGDGFGPWAGLISDKEGAVYGTTQWGGSSANGGNGFGTVFKLTPPANGRTAWKETILYSFTGGSDGFGPLAGLIFGKDGALYGTTAEGGSSCPQNFYGCGTVFKLTPPANGRTAWKETILYSFTGGGDGFGPSAGLISDKEGALYGATQWGGSSANGGNGFGTVFKLTPPANGRTAWKETILYSFLGGNDGASPSAGLIFGKDGALYGTTAEGGSGGFGTVFKLTVGAR